MVLRIPLVFRAWIIVPSARLKHSDQVLRLGVEDALRLGIIMITSNNKMAVIIGKCLKEDMLGN